MFVLTFILNTATFACLCRLHVQRNQFRFLDSQFVPQQIDLQAMEINKNEKIPKWITTYGEALHNFEQLIKSASKTIHICGFALHLARLMPCGQSLADVLNERAEEGVKVYILMNSTAEYANLFPQQARQQLHPSVRLYASRNKSHEFKTNVFNQKGYSFTHIKMCCVDLSMMQVGCIDVDPWERIDYNVLNKNNFAWHEIAFVFRCTPAISQWVTSKFQCGSFNVCSNDIIPPFPLVCGGTYEANVMCKMIDTAEKSVYMEHQMISMGPAEDASVQLILESLAKKIAFVPDFQVIMVTNTIQDDEYNAISRHFSALSLQATKQHMNEMVRRIMSSSGLTFNENAQEEKVRYLELRCTGGQNLKTHSNIMIVDTTLAVRSSSNITSRSLGFYPCDMEMGIVTRSGVESLLHSLILLHCPLLKVQKPQKPTLAMFLEMVDSGLSHAKPVEFPKMPGFLIDWCMSISHLHSSSGHCYGKINVQEVLFDGMVDKLILPQST